MAFISYSTFVGGGEGDIFLISSMCILVLQEKFSWHMSRDMLVKILLTPLTSRLLGVDKLTFFWSQ
jgi:hypothetical protein